MTPIELSQDHVNVLATSLEHLKGLDYPKLHKALGADNEAMVIDVKVCDTGCIAK